VQVFLQGKLLGIDPFIRQAGDEFSDLAGRCLYTSILAETVPRTLLDRLGLSRQLLGSSGAGQFLVVLTDESLPAAHAFLVEVTTKLQQSTNGTLRLAWAATENLGGWTDVRKRLQEGMARWRGLNALDPAAAFGPLPESPAEADYGQLFRELPESLKLRWSGEGPLLLEAGEEILPLAHHTAPAAEGEGAASPAELASRAAGRPVWGVLRGDVDRFEARLRRASTIEEHLQVSMFYRQFFSGEVQVLCSQGEFWQKVTVLYTGGDDFAVAGSWDALPGFAREMERLFKMSAEEFLKEYPGPEGKTLSMAIALAPSDGAPAVAVLAEAGQRLEVAKSAGRDLIDLFGRTLDWKSFTEAAEIRGMMTRLVDEFGCSPQFLGELGAFYRETDRVLATRTAKARQERPWRFHRRLTRVLEAPARQKEFQKARNALLAEFMGRRQAHVKLRPAGRVALEWARLAQEA
jgi:CRISPR-associated protein Csm1